MPKPTVPSTPATPAIHLELATLPTERLEARLCEWAATIAAADCHFLEMIAEFDRRRGWVSWGSASCADWLTAACALSPPAARERVRVARRLADLPRTTARFRSGELSYSKVRAISRVATADTEPELLQLAQAATASQLEEIVRAWRKCEDVLDLSRHERQRANRYLDFGYDDDGSLVGRFRIPAEEAPVVRKAIENLTAPPPARAGGDDVSAETSTPAQRRADALVAVADAALNSGPRRPHERTMTIVEVEQDVLAADTAGMCQTADDRVALAAETARRLACESLEMVVLVDGKGDEVARSKPTRTIPRRIRRALRRRDGDRCRFPGCSRRGGVEAHHLVHRARGGGNEFTNLATLCRHHHHQVHEGGFTLLTDDGGETFTAIGPDSRTITVAAMRQGGRGHQSRNPRDLPTRLGVDTAPDTLMVGTGERMCHDSMRFAVGAAVLRHRASRQTGEAAQPLP